MASVPSPKSPAGQQTDVSAQVQSPAPPGEQQPSQAQQLPPTARDCGAGVVIDDTSSANKFQLRCAFPLPSEASVSAGAVPGHRGPDVNLEHYRHRGHANDLICDDGIELTTSSLSSSRPSSATISAQRSQRNSLNTARNALDLSSAANGHVFSLHSQQALPHLTQANRDVNTAIVLPAVLPPPPKVISVSRTAAPEMVDFATMSTDYLNMLASRPESDEDSKATEDNGQHHAYRDDMRESTSFMTAPNPLSMSSDYAVPSDQGYLTSPQYTPLNEYLTSPGDTPFSTFLLTPNEAGQRELEPAGPPVTPYTPYMDSDDTFGIGCFSDDSLTRPVMDLYDDSFAPGGDTHMALFADAGPAVDYNNFMQGLPSVEKHPHPHSHVDTASAAVSPNSISTPSSTIDLNQLYTMSPTSLDDDYMPPPPPPSRESRSKRASSRNSASNQRHTGTRKNVSPETLIPVDAPIQKRIYTTPSATSRRSSGGGRASSSASSVSAGRKRTRSQVDDDEDELAQGDEDQVDPNTVDRSKMSSEEFKRLQNTLAARKSRKRKLEYLRELEAQVEYLTGDRDEWKTRALTMRDLLRANGVEVPEF